MDETAFWWKWWIAVITLIAGLLTFRHYAKRHHEREMERLAERERSKLFSGGGPLSQEIVDKAPAKSWESRYWKGPYTPKGPDADPKREEK